MSEHLGNILDRLERVAGYDGPWLVINQETRLLRERLLELRDREERQDDVLVVALVGGSGVGKSTLLNALAGDELAQTSEYRPCTSSPTVYYPPGAEIEFASKWKRVSGSALENLVIIDTPDSDTIVTAHREIVIEVLRECDLILMCADSEKYLDEATWSLLRPLQSERAIVCVETKASKAPGIREDWLRRLDEEGFTVSGHFRVNSRRTFDRKVSGGVPDDEEYDFQKLEQFLQRELTKERIRRIKRSNTSGLLVKTMTTLDERVSPHGGALDGLEDALKEADGTLQKAGFDLVRQRLFAEPHLWNYALGRETSLRAKGVVGTIFRLLETVRTLPARLTGWSFLSVRPGTGHQAASILADKDLLDSHLNVASEPLHRAYDSVASAVALAFTKAGFEAGAGGDAFETYSEKLNERVAEVLRGPARDRVVSRARMMTSWPLALLLDAAPVGFFVFSAYAAVTTYFRTEFWTGAQFIHAATVLGIILAVELFGLSVVARFFAWSARRAAVRDLRMALAGPSVAFPAVRGHLAEARKLASEVATLSSAVKDDTA